MTLFTPPHLLDSRRWCGMRVGLLGGSFNPPHAGHVHASHVALKYLQLDCVWWLVTPQNPLKQETGRYAERLAECLAMTRHCPRIVISDLECHTGTCRSVDTIRVLKRRFPGTDFVFLAGTDILPQLDRWHRWRDLGRQIPLTFIARPPAIDLVRQSRFRMLKNENHFPAHGEKPSLVPGKTYWLMHENLRRESSTEARKLNTIK